MQVQEIEQLINNYPQLNLVKEEVFEAYGIMCECYLNGGKILLCGNGGSAADCEHIVGELMKEYRMKRKIPKVFISSLQEWGADEGMLENIVGALPAISLTSHLSFQTAFNNDNAAEYVFAQQLYALGRKGDVLLAITTSGNSKNIINAAIMAKACGIKVIALTGSGGGKIRGLANVLINVPAKETARIQELHLPVYHTLCGMLEDYFFQNGQKEE